MLIAPPPASALFKKNNVFSIVILLAMRLREPTLAPVNEENSESDIVVVI